MVTGEYKLHGHCSQAGQQWWLVSINYMDIALRLGNDGDWWVTAALVAHSTWQLGLVQAERRGLIFQVTKSWPDPQQLLSWCTLMLELFYFFGLLLFLCFVWIAFKEESGSMKYRFVWNWMLVFLFVQLAWNAGQSELGTCKIPTVQHRSVYAESGKSPVPHVGSSTKPPAARPSHQDLWSPSHFVMWTWHPRKGGPAQIRNKSVCADCTLLWMLARPALQAAVKLCWPSTPDQNLYAPSTELFCSAGTYTPSWKV